MDLSISGPPKQNYNIIIQTVYRPSILRILAQYYVQPSELMYHLRVFDLAIGNFESFDVI